jgi:hypothetical protein
VEVSEVRQQVREERDKQLVLDTEYVLQCVILSRSFLSFEVMVRIVLSQCSIVDLKQ